MSIWLSVLVASVACYLLKLIGVSLPEAVLAHPRIQRVASLLPVAMLSALIATDLFDSNRSYHADWHTLAGVAAGAVARPLAARRVRHRHRDDGTSTPRLLGSRIASRLRTGGRCMSDYALASIEEIAEIDDGRRPFRPVRHHFGITSFGATVMTARADGERLINEHSESEPESGEELYLVIAGHADFEIDGTRHDAPTGTFVHVRPGVTRTAFAREAGTSVLAVGGAPAGRPYSPSGWEVFAPLMPLFASGSYEQGADRAEALLEAHPPYSGMLYNTACFESLAGRTELALTHLRQAIELLPALAELARDDDDFASLREESAFAEIVGAGGKPQRAPG